LCNCGFQVLSNRTGSPAFCQFQIGCTVIFSKFVKNRRKPVDLSEGFGPIVSGRVGLSLNLETNHFFHQGYTKGASVDSGSASPRQDPAAVWQVVHERNLPLCGPPLMYVIAL
jgi:hypothetical protein